MKRKSRKSRLMIDFMELSSDTTRFRRELQYLRAEAWSERLDARTRTHVPAASGACWPEGPRSVCGEYSLQGSGPPVWTAPAPCPQGQQTPRVQR